MRVMTKVNSTQGEGEENDEDEGEEDGEVSGKDGGKGDPEEFVLAFNFILLEWG